MTCPHGESHPAACLDCVADPPPADQIDRPNQKLKAARWVSAGWDGRCARNPGHLIEAGDQIGMLEGIGWSCRECAS